MTSSITCLSASPGYGPTDRWELSVMAPWDRIKNNGGDRVGFVNGYLYSGRFSDGGMGDIRLATKLGLNDRMSPSRVSLSLFADLPTGNKNSRPTTGSPHFCGRLQWTSATVSSAP